MAQLQLKYSGLTTIGDLHAFLNQLASIQVERTGTPEAIEAITIAREITQASLSMPFIGFLSDILERHGVERIRG